MARWYKFCKSRRTRLTAGIFTCPHCGAVYEVTYTRMEARDDDRAICDKCHKVMKEWNDTFSRSFKLKVGSAKRRDRRYLAGSLLKWVVALIGVCTVLVLLKFWPFAK